jgi:phosphoribosylanthranilate isomerase
MTWIKICGITNLGDALASVEAGADAVGFVFHEKSPRHVDPQAAREIIAALPEKLEKVGVFAEMPANPLDLVRDTGLTAIQCRLGSRAAPLADGKASLGRPVRMVVTLSATRLLQNEKKLQGLTAEFLRLAESPKRPTGFDTFLLDSTAPDRPGGTGQPFNWKKVAPLVQVMNRSVKVIAAGGLTPTNVGEAMRLLRPWGVDVSSGVESEPGRKDRAKVRAFINAVRTADKANPKS